jgi:hypothetical protein
MATDAVAQASISAPGLTVALLQAGAYCDGLLGAALTSSDGHAIVATGSLQGTNAPTCGGELMAQLDAQLAMLRAGPVQEALLWTATGPWYLCRIGEWPQVLVLQALPMPHPAMLRHAGQVTARRLANLLAMPSAAVLN